MFINIWKRWVRGASKWQVKLKDKIIGLYWLVSGWNTTTAQKAFEPCTHSLLILLKPDPSQHHKWSFNASQKTCLLKAALMLSVILLFFTHFLNILLKNTLFCWVLLLNLKHSSMHDCSVRVFYNMVAALLGHLNLFILFLGIRIDLMLFVVVLLRILIFSLQDTLISSLQHQFFQNFLIFLAFALCFYHCIFPKKFCWQNWCNPRCYTYNKV